ncbi:hypothetical protein ABWU93_11550 [Xanthomonas translucens pv. translucens]|uniref:hypothetical protein n=1 Tax=Xanthomonas campestris pv. translucens TaxID=343 RepID=UPI003F6FDA0E
MAGGGEVIFEWAVGFVDECAAAGVVLPPQITLMLPYVDVVLWARQQRKPPTWRQISERWGVHRATAYRWKRVLRAQPQSEKVLETHPPEPRHQLLSPQLSGTAWYQGLNQGPRR